MQTIVFSVRLEATYQNFHCLSRNNLYPESLESLQPPLKISFNSKANKKCGPIKMRQFPYANVIVSNVKFKEYPFQLENIRISHFNYNRKVAIFEWSKLFTASFIFLFILNWFPHSIATNKSAKVFQWEKKYLCVDKRKSPTTKPNDLIAWLSLLCECEWYTHVFIFLHVCILYQFLALPSLFSNK